MRKILITALVLSLALCGCASKSVSSDSENEETSQSSIGETQTVSNSSNIETETVSQSFDSETEVISQSTNIETNEDSQPSSDESSSDSREPETESESTSADSDSSTSDLPKESYVYMGSLSTDQGDGNINSVEISGNKITVKGSVYIIPESEYAGYFDGELESGVTYTFTISDNIVYYRTGGSLGSQGCSESDFMETVSLYNGLGLILHVENEALVEAEISS